MKNIKATMKRSIFLVVLVTAVFLAGACHEAKLTILSTNDSHSRLLGVPIENYDPTHTGDGTIGGAARVAAIIDQERAEKPDVLTFAAGDFIDGTIFITAEDGSADLNLLKSMGYDAACIGNHEMSMGPDGLADMILKAMKPMIPLLCANFKFSNENTPLGHSDDLLESLHSETEQPDKYIFDYIVRVTPSGAKVGIFGLLGQKVLMPDSLPVKFSIKYPKIQSLVNKLRWVEKVDVVVCVMHASFSVDGSGVGSGEIADMAKKVRGIDVICAGHSHSLGAAKVAYTVPGSTWTTTIIEAGDDFENVAEVDLTRTKEMVHGSQTETREIPVDDTILGLPAIIDRVNGFIPDIEANYLSLYPVLGDGTVFRVLAHADFAFGRLNSMYMVTDAMRQAAGADLAVCTPGADTASVETHRDGEIAVYDAFQAIPHSMGRDGKHGGALYKFYLKGSDILKLFELGTCLLGQLTSDLFVVPSGMRIIFDTKQPIFKRVLKMYSMSADETSETLLYDSTDPKYILRCGWISDPQKLYSASSSLLVLIGLQYVSGLLPFVDVWPRDAAGKLVKWEAVADLDRFVVSGEFPGDGATYEVKAWYSVALWLKDLPGGIVPARFDDDPANNPIGPPWRRIWDVQKYGSPD